MSRPGDSGVGFAAGRRRASGYGLVMNDSTASLAPKGEVTTIELDRHERAIARRSAESRATVPSVEFTAEVDMTPSLARAAELGCGTTALLVRAAAHALTAVPRVNASYRDGRYELYARINIGVTIADEGLYVMPTVFDADQKSAIEIATELAELFVRARARSLTPPELTGATFTVTDSIAYDIATLTPLIIPPQAAALAAGPIRDVPVVRDGAVVAGHTMVLTLACDHRIVYGAHASAFLEELKAHLQEAMP
jgi:pyruvate dehydrogenase E2 component (dihydrolipoamide acetyltransferase)